MKIDLKILTTLLFLLLSWVLVGGSLYFIYQSRLQEFLAHQHQISDQGVTVTVGEIRRYVERRNQLLSILIRHNRQVLSTLAAQPPDGASARELWTIVADYFSELRGVVLADATGRVLYSSPEGSPAEPCRDDLDRFARHREMPEIFVHADPDPSQFHIDIMATVPGIVESGDAILQVRLGTEMLQTLLANGQPYNHNLLLVRQVPDQRHRIELIAGGTRASLSRSGFVSEGELRTAFAQRAVEGTHWRLVDFVAPDYIDSIRSSYRDSALIIGLLYLLLSSLFLAVFWFSERRRMAQEIQIRRLNQTQQKLLRRRADQLEQSKQMLSYQSSHDALTGLINRREFELRLQEAIEDTRAASRHHSVLLYIDIDHIKVINETCGLVAGDEMLKQLSRSLFGLLRRNDTLARMGGDEFGILLRNCDRVQAGLIANTLREQIGQHGFIWESRHFDITASIGIAEINDATVDVSDLLRQVDSACSAAKEQGRNQVHLYHSEDTMFRTRRSEMYWHGEAIRLINDGGMVLFGQKIQAVAVDDPTPWYEVLVRLRDDQNKLVFPDRFIPALEQYGGIEKLDRAIVRASIEYLARHPGIRLNVNLSGKSVGNRDTLQAITDLVEEFQVDPDCLVFEITETVAMTNVRLSRRFIEGIKQLGCKMALDDFGSGMSSFSYLKNLEVDFVKLDGSFVRNLHQDPVHHEMVRSINSVTQVMGRQCIAEFVESEAVMIALRDIGVAYAQGYHIHRPSPLDDIDTVQDSHDRAVDILLT